MVEPVFPLEHYVHDRIFFGFTGLARDHSFFGPLVLVCERLLFCCFGVFAVGIALVIVKL